MRDDGADRHAGADAATSGSFHVTAAPGVRAVARGTSSVYYATGADSTEGAVDPTASDAVVVGEPTRFHDHHRLHGAVNVLDVPRVAGESRLLDHALRADLFLLDDRDFGAEVGRQIAAAGVSAEATRLASLLGPDGNGVTTVGHDDPDGVGPVRAAGRNGFVVETERDRAAPTVRDASGADAPDDAMEPDGRYDPDDDLGVDR